MHQCSGNRQKNLIAHENKKLHRRTRSFAGRCIRFIGRQFHGQLPLLRSFAYRMVSWRKMSSRQAPKSCKKFVSQNRNFTCHSSNFPRKIYFHSLRNEFSIHHSKLLIRLAFLYVISFSFCTVRTRILVWLSCAANYIFSVIWTISTCIIVVGSLNAFRIHTATCADIAIGEFTWLSFNRCAAALF